MIIGGTIGEKFADASLKNYEIPPGNEKAMRACELLVTEGTRGLILHGPVGLGKTHLFAGVARLAEKKTVEFSKLSVFGDCFELAHRPYTVAYWPILELVDALRAEMGHGARSIVQDCCDVDLLLLDDAGEERETPLVVESLAHIINARYNAMRPMGVSTNLSLNGLKAKYGDRAFSRWWETCEMIDMSGLDYRTLKKGEK